MSAQDILAEFINEYNDCKEVPLEPLLELHSYGLLDEGHNSAPSGEAFLEFVRLFPFAKCSGNVYGKCFSIEEVSGTIPSSFNKEQTLGFFIELLDAFGDADEKELSSDGSFRFWFD